MKATSPENGSDNFSRSESDRKDLERVIDLLPLRVRALKDASNGLKEVHPSLDEDQLFALASTDLFVEKAQFVLTRRARLLGFSGVVTIVLTVSILFTSVLIIKEQLLSPLQNQILDSGNALALRIFQATALSAFVLVGIKLLIGLARSFFHEAISLLERRHALRFGRLYVYLKKGDVDDEGLVEAFQWNKVSRTSFLDIEPDKIAETLLHKALDALKTMPPEILRAIKPQEAELRKRRSFFRRTSD